MKFKLTGKISICLTVAAAVLAITGCTRGYNSSECDQLSDRISSGQQLSQDDYAKIIEQYDNVLEYLVQRTDSLMLIQDPARRQEHGQRLRAEAEFNERWQVMFDFGSALYQARAAGLLNDLNLNNYMELIPYNERLSRNMASI